MNIIRTTQANPGPNFINLGIGQPGLDLLPLDCVRRAADIRLSAGDTTLLNYGYELGDGYFRLALARFLERRYGMPVKAESLMTTAGASQALDLICTRFSKPGDVVFVEEPTYFLALRIFGDHDQKIIGLPTDDNGLVIEAVVEALAEYRPAFLYTVPTFQNPTGHTMAKDRRRRLVDLAEAFEFYIVADEVYHLLDYAAAPPLPLAGFVESERVLSVGSFSKILAPGLRLGWVQAAPDLLQRLAASGLVDSGGGLNHFTSNLIRVVLEEGWQEEHLVSLKAVYGQRVEVMNTALKHNLGDIVRFSRPAGGFFFWIELPQEIDTALLLETAYRHKVGFQPGHQFSSSQGLHNYARLSFAYYNQKDIEQGIVRLGNAIREGVR